jgi:cyclic pyranopterin phosphate synthase
VHLTSSSQGDTPVSDPTLSHVDSDGKIKMVDVADKAPTRRVAEARCLLVSSVDPTTLRALADGQNPITAARLAGIFAAKNTANLIPLCHPLALHDVSVDIQSHPRGAEIHSRVVTIDRTGVEMEALTACSFAALSLVNSLLASDAHAHVEEAVVLSKSGGASGDWGRSLRSAHE